MEGEIITPKIMLDEIVQVCKNKILKEMEKERERQEIRQEAEQRRKECLERIERLWSPHQKELIHNARNGGGDFVPLND